MRKTNRYNVMSRLLASVVVVLLLVQTGLAQQLSLTPLKKTGVYGEKIGWEVRVRDPNAAPTAPANPQVEPNESGKPNVEYSTIRMDNINGTHIYGQLAKPKMET